METKFEIRKNLEDEVFYLFTKPDFLFSNMFKAEVTVDDRKRSSLQVFQ